MPFREWICICFPFALPFNDGTSFQIPPWNLHPFPNQFGGLRRFFVCRKRAKPDRSGLKINIPMYSYCAVFIHSIERLAVWQNCSTNRKLLMFIFRIFRLSCYFAGVYVFLVFQKQTSNESVSHCVAAPSCWRTANKKEHT